MRLLTTLQLTAAAVLALGLNGAAMANSVDLNGIGPVTKVAALTSSGSAFAPASVRQHGFAAMSDRTQAHTRSAGFIRTGVRWCPPIPEPSVYLLMAAGVGLVGFMSYRRQRLGMTARPALLGV